MPEIDSPETAKRIFRASRTWIFDRTVGIYAQARGGNPRLEGSGVLLQIADAPFMLSAGHVLKASEDAAISALEPQPAGMAVTVGIGRNDPFPQGRARRDARSGTLRS